MRTWKQSWVAFQFRSKLQISFPLATDPRPQHGLPEQQHWLSLVYNTSSELNITSTGTSPTQLSHLCSSLVSSTNTDNFKRLRPSTLTSEFLAWRGPQNLSSNALVPHHLCSFSPGECNQEHPFSRIHDPTPVLHSQNVHFHRR